MRRPRPPRRPPRSPSRLLAQERKQGPGRGLHGPGLFFPTAFSNRIVLLVPWGCGGRESRPAQPRRASRAHVYVPVLSTAEKILSCESAPREDKSVQNKSPKRTNLSSHETKPQQENLHQLTLPFPSSVANTHQRKSYATAYIPHFVAKNRPLSPYVECEVHFCTNEGAEACVARRVRRDTSRTGRWIDNPGFPQRPDRITNPSHFRRVKNSHLPAEITPCGKLSTASTEIVESVENRRFRRRRGTGFSTRVCGLIKPAAQTRSSLP